MDREEFTDEIEKAIEMVKEANEIVDNAVKGKSIRANYEAYGGYGFSQLLGNGNPYDSSLYSLIDKYKEE